MSNDRSPHVLPEHVQELHRALTEQAEQRRPPCRGRSDWTSEDRDIRAEAATACTHCSLLEPCRTYAEAAGETFGVWAGVDRSEPGPRRRRRTS